jgi:VIT1/CCC1 family predicted Fe2+/Mn2+ transporter
MFIFLFVMSFDAPNSTKKPLNWLVQILMFGIAIGLASLIPISVYFAYKAIQQGQHAHTILIMSLVLTPLFLALFYYLYTIRAANRPQSSS